MARIRYDAGDRRFVDDRFFAWQRERTGSGIVTMPAVSGPWADDKLEGNYPDEFIAEILEGVISYERQ